MRETSTKQASLFSSHDKKTARFTKHNINPRLRMVHYQHAWLHRLFAGRVVVQQFWKGAENIGITVLKPSLPTGCMAGFGHAFSRFISLS
ncbi:hypothetical protein [Thalassospira marina]|uniref:hypothetical protein n=1 Tax=Thalassospira marina TaxID=2048283 RepID=UPI001055CAFE|nr:hypothetical protein [Thalassospira marina]